MSCRPMYWLCVLCVVVACAAEDPTSPETASPSNLPTAGASDGTSGGALDAMGGQTGEGGGHADACFAETWRGPDSPRVMAHCQTPGGSVKGPRYCTCDTRACPLDSDGVPNRTCAIEVPFQDVRCDDTLFQVCAVRGYKVGWCDVSGLLSQTVTCWTQPDGTHRCQCPGSEQLVASTQTDCNLALYSACAGDCESERGRCEYVVPPDGLVSGLGQFRCQCEQGVPGTSPAYFCEDALRRHCSPECSNARGACWKVPDATGLVNTADCLCNGSQQFVHLRESEWNPHGEACRAPLAQVCGS